MTTLHRPRFRPSPETFLVEEIPAYEPCGSGEHTYLWIEKRDLTTLDAISVLARRLGVAARDIGYAGMKDRHAVTRQWVSVPRIDPEAALQAFGEGPLRVLRASQHGNKLRVGHVRGNRFAVTVDTPDDETARGAVAESLRAMGDGGLPNRFGLQRFGRDADNATRGVQILRGERRERDARRRRLWISALQSSVFNEVLRLRQQGGRLREVLDGDVLQKLDTGGVFVTSAAALDQRRVDAGEVVITGPMPGSWAREPPPETAARQIEDQALETIGVERSSFASLGKDLPGTRRPLWVRVDDAGAVETSATSLRLSFALPAGSYATVLLEEIGVEVVDARDRDSDSQGKRDPEASGDAPPGAPPDCANN